MKRLAVLALTAGVGLAGRAAAGDPAHPGLPPPTGMAATVPVVPAPYLGGAEPAAGPVRFRERFGGGRPVATGAEGRPGPFSGFSLFARKPKEYVAEPYDPYPAKKGWCENCAPSARHPLPPPPAGVDLGAYGVRRASGEAPSAPAPAPAANHPAPPPPALPAVGGCADGSCGGGVGRPARSCWDCFKKWLCYRQTPVHLPVKPTERYAPLYTYGTCREGKGHGAGCGGGTCATGHGPAGRAGAAGCTPCPTPGGAVLPGYRLANPELPGLTAQPRSAGPVANPVVPAGYRPQPQQPPQPPAAAVPYKTAWTPTATPNPRPFAGQ
jgi:hypothetical protein